MIIQEENQKGMTGIIFANFASSSDTKRRINPNIDFDFYYKKGQNKERCYAKCCDFSKKQKVTWRKIASNLEISKEKDL